MSNYSIFIEVQCIIDHVKYINEAREKKIDLETSCLLRNYTKDISTQVCKWSFFQSKRSADMGDMIQAEREYRSSKIAIIVSIVLGVVSIALGIILNIVLFSSSYYYEY